MPLPCRCRLSFYAVEQVIGSARRRANVMQNGQTESWAQSDAEHAEQSTSESFPAFQRGFRRTIRRPELRQIVPLADTTIYEMERRGDFPRRFYLTSRCVVWDLAEVEAWVEERRRASNAQLIQKSAPAERTAAEIPTRQAVASSALKCIDGGYRVGVRFPPETHAAIISAHSWSMCRRCCSYSALL